MAGTTATGGMSLMQRVVLRKFYGAAAGDPALPLYRRQLLAWTKPGADFVLHHWGKRHALDWRPMGPRRRTSERIERLFAPEFELVSKESGDMPVPLPIGPCVRGASYWFRRRS